MRKPDVAAAFPLDEAESSVPRIVIEAGYQKAVEAAEAEMITVSPAHSRDEALGKLERADGLLLSGGGDVDPRRYGGEPNVARGVSEARDRLEFVLVQEALERGMPVLAICRGLQVMNVALRGSLYQDLGSERRADPPVDHDRQVELDRPAHEIRVERPDHLTGVFEDEVFRPNSSHHQGIRDLGQGLEPVAWAEDGLVEAVELRDGAHGPWVVGVQWHPERMLPERSGTHRRLFRRFGQALRG